MTGKLMLTKIDRFCAWALVAVMVIFFISGYGMTREIIPAEFSKFIHDDLLPIPGMTVFAVHSAYGMHIAFKRWKIWNPVWKWTLIVYAFALILGTVFVQFFVAAGAGNMVPETIEL